MAPPAATARERPAVRARRGRRRRGRRRGRMRRKAPSAVCCCFPFNVVELVVLAAVRVPATLCRYAVRGGRRRCVRSAKRKAAKARKVEAEFPGTPMAEHLG
ncbi:Os04g0194900 [Oryza sativa Japonica Group]|uniref:Os04g0194900 protein n=1 Tax=Oryza sativa subsp. japonica TaxID=39947 RepID=A0A0P0W7U9_ORYSJ|nr:Os04g0194900 [Oryza sativa Japonica Group]